MKKSEEAFLKAETEWKTLKQKLMQANRTGINLEEVRRDYAIARFRLLMARDWVEKGDRVRTHSYFLGVAGVLDELTEDEFTPLVIQNWISSLPQELGTQIADFMKVTVMDYHTNLEGE